MKDIYVPCISEMMVPGIYLDQQHCWPDIRTEKTVCLGLAERAMEARFSSIHKLIASSLCPCYTNEHIELLTCF